MGLLTALRRAHPRSAFGRAARLPLRLIPRGSVLRVLSGPNRGARWVAGSFVHSCWLGSYEAHKQREIAGLLRPGMVAWDLGANVGFFTILMARRVGPEGRVVAFEPLPDNAKKLRRHVALNRLANVTVLEAAVSDRDGTAVFGGEKATGKLTDDGSIEVRTMALDAHAELPRPDLIKMDIEGGEEAALRGAPALVAARSATWLIATHSPELWTQCRAIMAGAGYALTTSTGVARWDGAEADFTATPAADDGR